MGIIGNEQRARDERTMTRGVRTAQDTENKDTKTLQADLNSQTDLLTRTTDPKERKIIKENIAEIKSQLANTRSQVGELGTTQNGRVQGGGIQSTQTDATYGNNGGGASGGMGSGPSAVTGATPSKL